MDIEDHMDMDIEDHMDMDIITIKKIVNGGTMTCAQCGRTCLRSLPGQFELK